MRGKVPAKTGAAQSKQLIFRNMMIENRDLQIVDVIWNYFDAVRSRWPGAWAATGQGLILNKTNGFRGLMRFLKPAYLYLTAPGGVPSSAEFAKIFQRIKLNDDEFVIDRFVPATSGEVTLFNTLKTECEIPL